MLLGGGESGRGETEPFSVSEDFEFDDVFANRGSEDKEHECEKRVKGLKERIVENRVLCFWFVALEVPEGRGTSET
jgi:hypothetical protein